MLQVCVQEVEKVMTDEQAMVGRSLYVACLSRENEERQNVARRFDSYLVPLLWHNYANGRDDVFAVWRRALDRCAAADSPESEADILSEGRLLRRI